MSGSWHQIPHSWQEEWDREHKEPKDMTDALKPGYERFTDRARKVMQLAEYATQKLPNCKRNLPIYLYAILQEHSGVGAYALRECGNIALPMAILQGDINLIVDYPDVKDQLIADAIESANELQDNFVGTEHILLALLKKSGENLYVSDLLLDNGTTAEKLKEQTLLLINKVGPATKEIDSKNFVEALEKLSTLHKKIETALAEFQQGSYREINTISKANKDIGEVISKLKEI